MKLHTGTGIFFDKKISFPVQNTFFSRFDGKEESKMDVQNTVKREVVVEEKKGLANTRNLILVGVMMAVGIVLRMFAGVIALGNMHPNFLIATYCLAIFIIKPNLKEAAAIGLISGAISQIGTSMPWLGLGSETIGAIAMCLLTGLVLPKYVKPVVCTFLATLVSGFAFIGLAALTYAKPMPGAQFVSMAVVTVVTALLNMVIVTVLSIPVNKVMGNKEE
jgi:hypothetical protein